MKYILDNNLKLPRLDGFLIHGGGWKKLSDQALDNVQFKKIVYDVCGLKNIINYYGMVEQTGSIFLECNEGYLHSSIFSDIIIRNNDYGRLTILNQIFIIVFGISSICRNSNAIS